MNRRTFMKIGLMAGVGLMLPRSVFGETPPPPQGSNPPNILKHRPTVADRQAAAQNMRQMGLLPGAAGATNIVNIPGLPHYFGPYANYANSPMPKGPIAGLTLDAGGSGYSAAPEVNILDVYGTGVNATATATVVAGVITAITLNTPGSDYSAPLVDIVDPTGTGAAATAAIGAPFAGGIHKFVDALAGLGPDGANNLGNYIPVATAEPLSMYSAYTPPLDQSDYYEIALVEFTQQVHSDLPPTRFRGYVQLETPWLLANGHSAHVPLVYPNGNPIMRPNDGGQYFAVDQPRYLGPTIVCMRDVAVRLTFINLLPTGAGGDLFIPVDETIMGAGEGPVTIAGVHQKYKHNRATLHLHGGLTPWISDGTPHQWVVPADETTPYPQGVSTYNVPDMWFDNQNRLVAPGTAGSATSRPGLMTFYYTNQQSARLMFYHDHAFGITRLNVYVGEAAGYVLTDEVEQDLIGATNVTGVKPAGLETTAILPGIGIPLILQDKTFVDAATIGAQDPNWHWDLDANGNPQTGSLWVPSVYMPAQNPWDPSGASAFGRWQYGPWFWPPTTNIAFGPIPNEYYDPVNAPWEPPTRPAMPNPSMGMEAFNDTTMVNGVVYPYMELEAQTYRFRILNAANDRFFNLHFHVADPDVITSDGRANTEVRMVPAMATPGFPPLWSTDGRAGGVPDPALMGPDWIQIGTEGGFLPEPVVIPPQPINWNMNATAFNVGNVTDHSLLLGCAERADVLVDFSNFAGRTLILYNDAPTAFPALDPRYDYYTGTPDQTDAGGVPTTQPGYGPNTRTVMQIRIKGPVGGSSLAGITVLTGGADYLASPEVDIDNGGGSGATASAFCSVDHVTVLSGGSGYASAPSVNFSGGGGSGAAATATISRGRVTKITVTSSGSGYTSAPTITLTGGAPTVAATANSALYVSAITLDTPGSGYTSLPDVTLVGGGGYSATAVATFPSGTPYDLAQLQAVWRRDGDKPGVFEVYQDPIIMPQAAYNSAYGANFPADNSVFVQLHDFSKAVFGGIFLPNHELFRLTIKNGGTGYSNPVSVSITGGGGTGATATATQTGGVITSIFLTNGGTGYTSAPTITVTGGAGSGAVITANEFPIEPKAIHDEMGAAYDIEYGRMGGLLGLELPVTNSLFQNMSLYPYISPPVDILSNAMTPMGTLTDGTQIWKITQNGVDTHPMHFHIANVQVLNRVAWDGALLPTEPNELGWKETVRTNPLEHLVVALRPYAPILPFDVPNSVRAIDVTKPLGVTLMGGPQGFVDPLGTATPMINRNINFGWEFVWHCHILSHEEMDMMHALSFAMAPRTPTNLTATLLNGPRRVLLTWTNAAANATAFVIQRARNASFTTDLQTWTTAGVVTSFTDNNGIANNTAYYYRVQAINVVGDTVVYPAPAVGYPHVTAASNYSAVASVGAPPAAPTNLTVAQLDLPGNRRVTVRWTDNADNETNFTVQRATGVTGPWTNVSTTVPASPGTGLTVTYFDTATLTGNRIYYYRVLASNAAGSSAATSPVSIVTAP